MIRLSATLQGIPELAAKLDRLMFVVSDAELLAVMKQGGEIIAEEWRSRVPRDTDRYYDSIQVAEGEPQDGFPTVDIFTDAVNPDDEYPYPVALEFGTSKMAARPSAGPAFEAASPAAIALIRAELDTRIEEAWSGI